MREFKKRRSQRAETLNFFIRLCGTFVLLLITAAAVHGAFDMYGRLSAASAGQHDAEAQLQELQGQEAAVSAQVAELSTPRGQEAVMREHYGVVKPGEGVIQIVHNAPTSTPGQGSSQSWYGRLFDALFSW